MLIILGTIILISTVILMIKKYDNRVLLLGSGLLMALIGGDITTAFKGYSNGLASTSIMNAIISAAGFAAVCHGTTRCVGLERRINWG